MELLAEIAKAIIEGNHQRVDELTGRVIEEGVHPKSILDDGLIAGMNVVGERFRVHEIFLPDVLMAAKAMYAGMDLLRPLLIEEGIPSLGRVVIGTVQGDLHDIGKNLVGIMLRGAGFDVVDLGHDVAPEKMIETAREQQIPVIGMSALLTTTMPVMKEVVQRLKDEGLAGDIKTVVGGAPVTEKFAHDIGADAYGFDAANAVAVVKRLAGVV
ncbi:MAG: corrinoid protein [Gemmatimonadales bacterium]|jgi:5-methyltetrahydrofolate--homocysteine methyltransferase